MGWERIRKPVHAGVVVSAAVALAALLPAGALGASGSITRAEATYDWSQGGVAAVVYRTVECVEMPPLPEPPRYPRLRPVQGTSQEPIEYFSPCAWIPYATLGPESSEGCAAPDRRWPNIGEGVQLVWSDGERTGVGSARFDLPELPLEYGADAPLLCLSVIEADAERVACAQVFPSPCPPYAIVGRHYQLDSALLEAAQPPAPAVGSPVGAPAPPASGESGERKGRRPRCKQGKRPVKHGHSKRGRKKPKGRRRCKGRHHSGHHRHRGGHKHRTKN